MTAGSEQLILRERARKLAAAPQNLQPPQAELELLHFSLGVDHFGIDTAHVLEVSPLRDVTPLPTAPAAILGLVNIRGEIVAVLNLQKILDLPEATLGAAKSIIIVQADGVRCGIVAETTYGVAGFSRSAFKQSLISATESFSRFVAGVTTDRLAVIDIAEMIRSLSGDEATEGAAQPEGMV